MEGNLLWGDKGSWTIINKSVELCSICGERACAMHIDNGGVHNVCGWYKYNVTQSQMIS